MKGTMAAKPMRNAVIAGQPLPRLRNLSASRSTTGLYWSLCARQSIITIATSGAIQ